VFGSVTSQTYTRTVRYSNNSATMANRAKTGVEDDEKQSPTDLQEIQLQMNATTDEV